MAVTDRVGKGIGERLAVIEGVHGRIGVVQGVAVRAVRMDHQAPVTEVKGSCIGYGQGIPVGIMVIGKDITHDRIGG